MYAIYNKKLKNRALLAQKSLKTLKITMTSFARKVNEMRSKAFLLLSERTLVDAKG